MHHAHTYLYKIYYYYNLSEFWNSITAMTGDAIRMFEGHDNSQVYIRNILLSPLAWLSMYTYTSTE